MELNKALLIGKVLSISSQVVKLYDVVNINLLTERKYTLKDGQERTETLYIDVQAWGKLATETIDQIGVGDTVYVEGQIKYEKWKDELDQDRRKHSIKALAIARISQGNEKQQVKKQPVTPDVSDQAFEDFLPF